MNEENLLVAMNNLCARVPRKGSTAIWLVGYGRYGNVRVSRSVMRGPSAAPPSCQCAYESLRRTACATSSSSRQSSATVPKHLLYHPSPSPSPSSLTNLSPISALSITTRHISRIVSLHAVSFASETSSAYPSMVSRQPLEAVFISSSDAARRSSGRSENV